jgi:hypothetical protein
VDIGKRNTNHEYRTAVIKNPLIPQQKSNPPIPLLRKGGARGIHNIIRSHLMAGSLQAVFTSCGLLQNPMKENLS